MNKLRSRPLGDTTYQISKLLALWCKRRRFFKVFLSNSMLNRGGAIFGPGVIIFTNLVEDHKVMLHTKYERSRLCGFREEDFIRFSYEKCISPWVCPFWSRGHTLNKLRRGPLGDNTYQISKL